MYRVYRGFRNIILTESIFALGETVFELEALGVPIAVSGVGPKIGPLKVHWFRQGQMG